MKSYLQQNRFLIIAGGLSLLAHGVLLGVRFVAPPPVRAEPTDPGMEVILVNAKHAKAPLKADALAQANLDGGGNAESGRAKSPLPDMHRNETGEAVKSEKRIADLEKQQNELLTQSRHVTPYNAAPLTEKTKADPTTGNSSFIESAKEIARREAEIYQTVEDQNKRPRKTYITPSTREVGYADYYKTLQKRVEDFGTLNFPQQNGRKLYGELVIYIPIFQDGTIYMKEGGAHVEKSSGNTALDNAALAIVRRAAPYGRFPPKMLSNDKDDLWVIVTKFKFTRDEKLETNLSSGSN